MRTLCFALLLAFSFAFTANEVNEHTADVARSLQGYFARALKPQTAKGSFELQTANLTACQNAITAAQAQASQCTVFQIFNPNNTFTEGQVLSMIQTHCAPGPTSCSFLFEQALNNTLQQCVPVLGADLTLWTDVGEQLVLNRVPCLNINGVYCFSSWKNFTDRLATSNTVPLTQADLTAGCSDCTVAVLWTWLAFEPDLTAIYTTAYLDLLCSKDGTTYCYLSFMATVQAFQQPNANFTQLAPTFCVTCTFRYLFKWKRLLKLTNVNGDNNGAITNVTQYTQLMGWLCVTDLKMNYCNTIINNYDFSNVNKSCAGAAASASCSSTCKSAIHKALSDIGCCLESWLDYIGFVCQYTKPAPLSCLTFNPTNIKFLIQDLCTEKIPLGCGRLKYIAGEMVIANMAYEWCAANIDTCLAVVRQAIADQFDMDIDDVAAVIFADAIKANATVVPARRRLLQAASGPSVSVNINNLNNTLGAVSTSGLSPITVTNLNGAARPDPSQPSTTSATAEVYTVPNGAAGVVPSLGLALLALMLLLL